MQSLPESRLLKFHADTLHAVRSECRLAGAGEMARAVDILAEWARRQPHFTNHHLPREELETALVYAKGSPERAKARLERMCTLRTLTPQYFSHLNVRDVFREFEGVTTLGLLPQLTEDHCRVLIVRTVGGDFGPTLCLNFIRFLFMLSEFVRGADYCRGWVVVADFSRTDLAAYLAKLNLVEIGHAATAFLEGYGVRMRGMYLVSSSRLLDTLVRVFRKFATAKLAARLHSLRDLARLPHVLPAAILPADYGGQERPLAELHEELMAELDSEAQVSHRRVMFASRTDESRRPPAAFSELHAGLPGTFRTLIVD